MKYSVICTVTKLKNKTGCDQFQDCCKNWFCSQWLIAQLVERSLSVMKDPGSNLGEDICSFRY